MDATANASSGTSMASEKPEPLPPTNPVEPATGSGVGAKVGIRAGVAVGVGVWVGVDISTVKNAPPPSDGGTPEPPPNGGGGVGFVGTGGGTGAVYVQITMPLISGRWVMGCASVSTVPSP